MSEEGAAPAAGAAEADSHRGLAVGLARAACIVDLVTRPVRRDFATMMAVECAFADHFKERFLGKPVDEEVADPEHGLVVSLAAHQNIPQQLRRRAVPFVLAAALYPVVKPVALLSQAAVHLGFSMNGADHNLKAQRRKTLKAIGNDKVRPEGSQPAPSPGIQHELNAHFTPAQVRGFRSHAKRRRETEGHPGTKIKKVVVILMENHTTDTWLGRMEGIDGDANLFTADDKPNYLFSWWPTHGKFSERHRRWMMVHEQYAPSQLPFDYRLARDFAFFDDHHADQRGPSTGGHLNQACGWAHNVLNNPYPQAGLKQAVDLVDELSKYPGPQPEMPPFQIDSIFHQAEMAGLSWGNYGNGILTQIAGLHYSPNHLPSEQFEADWKAGRARDISYIAPPEQDNQHAPWKADAGMRWLAGLIKVIAESPEWYETAILIGHDDYGGFYDHVKPANVERWVHDPRYWLALGHRVPLTVVSPWVKAGFISSRDAPLTGDKYRALGSVPEFIREVFGLTRIPWKDGRPEWTRTDRDPLLDCLQFDKPLDPPDTTLPPAPVTGFLATLKAPWQLSDGIKARWEQAGSVTGLRDLKTLADNPLGFHEALQRRVMDSRLAYQASHPAAALS